MPWKISKPRIKMKVKEREKIFTIFEVVFGSRMQREKRRRTSRKGIYSQRQDDWFAHSNSFNNFSIIPTKLI